MDYATALRRSAAWLSKAESPVSSRSCASARVGVRYRGGAPLAVGGQSMQPTAKKNILAKSACSTSLKFRHRRVGEGVDIHGALGAAPLNDRTAPPWLLADAG